MTLKILENNKLFSGKGLNCNKMMLSENDENNYC